MTEVVDGIDAGKRRRLPIWMAERASYSDAIRNYGAGDGLQDAGSEPTSTTRMQKTKPAQAVDHLDEFEATLPKTVARQRKRQASRRNVGSLSSSNGTGETKTTTQETEEGGTTVDNAAASVEIENRKSKKRSKHSVVACSPVSSENEIELTVEDLVRIAEEKQHGPSTAKEPVSEVDPPSSWDSSVATGGGGGGLRQTAGRSQALSRCTKTPAPNFSDTRKPEDRNSGVEDLPSATPRTGDVARDMLDLLLGPLLKKPTTSEEHESRTVATETMNLIHKTSEPSTTSKQVLKEEVLRTKRKSSFKDKVAMLLD
ncbi:hypothetical protein B296_00024952 [Ensete ventricosum]|uniref:Uncharacterized protein n=1 Tax=Ensete ventricosum TaxID=4639 RepID=A0A427AE32_ENSVE|nr:hypothetical protein B296_00024952 [Ensete ventricosum]